MQHWKLCCGCGCCKQTVLLLCLKLVPQAALDELLLAGYACEVSMWPLQANKPTPWWLCCCFGVALACGCVVQAALDELLLAEESFSVVTPSLLDSIDNLAMLLLDIVWCAAAES
jgi:hypothetical protein